MSKFSELFAGPYFWAAFCPWVVAQICKMISSLVQTRRLDLRYLVSTGGMPSAHSALVMGLSTVVGLKEGFGSASYAVALGFAVIVMFDASTVRRAAGMQARLINEMVDELFKEHRFSEQKLKELLGHTRFEVFMGMIVGVLTGMLVYSWWTAFIAA